MLIDSLAICEMLVRSYSASARLRHTPMSVRRAVATAPFARLANKWNSRVRGRVVQQLLRFPFTFNGGILILLLATLTENVLRIFV